MGTLIRRGARPRRAPGARSEGEDVLLVSTSANEVRELCAGALDGAVLSEPELARLLSAKGDDAHTVFAAARQMRERTTGDAVFLYGFVYFSTYCRNECAFCFYRAGNDESPRYRKTADEVVAICRGLAASGVVLLDLTMGEDPRVLADGCAGLLDLVAAVHDGAGLPVMVSPGVVPDEVLAGLRERGAPACWSRTASSPASATRPGTARIPSRRCAPKAGSRSE